MNGLQHAPGAPVPVAVAAVARDAADEATLRAVRAVALAATDFSWLSRGDSVLIKAACNSGNRYPATTDPLALRAMIGLLRENQCRHQIRHERVARLAFRVFPQRGPEFRKLLRQGIRESKAEIQTEPVRWLRRRANHSGQVVFLRQL